MPSYSVTARQAWPTISNLSRRFELRHAGMLEGGLCLWDCEEAVRQQGMCSIGGTSVPCRRPTYTTECHGTAVMAGPVVAVSVLPASSRQAGQCKCLSSLHRLLAGS